MFFHSYENGKKFTIRASVGHRFYVRGLGFEHAERIPLGSQFVNHLGQTVELISRELESEPQFVYNFQVEDAHTYFVGDDAECCVLGHNADCTIGPAPAPSKNPLEAAIDQIHRDAATAISFLSINKRTDENPFPKISPEEMVAAIVASVAMAINNGVPARYIEEAIATVQSSRYNLGTKQDFIPVRLYGHTADSIYRAASNLKNSVENAYFDRLTQKELAELGRLSIQNLRDEYASGVDSAIRDRIRSAIENHLIVTEIRGINCKHSTNRIT